MNNLHFTDKEYVLIKMNACVHRDTTQAYPRADLEGFDSQLIKDGLITIGSTDTAYITPHGVDSAIRIEREKREANQKLVEVSKPARPKYSI